MKKLKLLFQLSAGLSVLAIYGGGVLVASGATLLGGVVAFVGAIYVGTVTGIVTEKFDW